MNSEDLYQRLLLFAKESQKLAKPLPKTNYNFDYGGQLIRSSASSGSNYIEAVEAISSKDFIHRLKICRKETKESAHWLELIKFSNRESIQIQQESDRLIREAGELVKIFSASITTFEKNRK